MTPDLPVESPLFEHLRVFVDGPGNGALNLAIDEILLRESTERPVLRFYRWSQPTLSFGCFFPSAGIPEEKRDLPAVRRWTGGGLVDHRIEGELTYALIVPASVPFFRVRPLDSYGAIHHRLLRALHVLGIEAELGLDPAPGPNSKSQNDSGAGAKSRTGACFQNPVAHDVIGVSSPNGGKTKLSGAGQRRSRQGLLHEGTLQMDRVGDWSTEIQEPFARLLGKEVTFEGPTPDAIRQAGQKQASERYRHPDWTHRH